MEPLRITTVQLDLAWENPAQNRQRLTELLKDLGGETDVIVLPEMFTTGFTMEAERLAEDTEGPTLTWMKEQSFHLNAVITGSFIAGDRGRYFNRLIWMRPDGHFSVYDKRHLFTLAGEQHSFTAGRDRLTVKCKDWKICPLVCYDLRFPVWSRNSVNGYDVLIYIANWPTSRSHAWRQLLIARAIENQCYTVGVNRIGEDGKNIDYRGDTCVVDYAGQVLYQSSGLESVHTATLDPGLQAAFRTRYGFLHDADSFSIDR